MQPSYQPAKACQEWAQTLGTNLQLTFNKSARRTIHVRLQTMLNQCWEMSYGGNLINTQWQCNGHTEWLKKVAEWSHVTVCTSEILASSCSC
ncbi:hypothetical protein DUNSADRAFT_18487 [Dunaliella salina]|uniref:Uncharacterized protein n=1 Tax=Dunaliella salina TaxID=3046 RepID=A0ABQ7GYY8_DUNSA|nr:hypothetical protein DUNSADRAFT_18487 [Dunaliella salina]|eukprot:KAF5839825.1 hypothetical protein DUNSADRAFT_18487 [Dunaliella salina]